MFHVALVSKCQKSISFHGNSHEIQGVVPKRTLVPCFIVNKGSHDLGSWLVRIQTLKSLDEMSLIT